MVNIKIKNKKGFYRLLFLYKSFLFKGVKFASDINDEELQNIIKALNIKKRYKRIEFIYDTACDQLDKYYEDKNVCDFSNSQCILQRSIENCNLKDGCCRVCKYVTNKGCSTRNLSCKLFYCETAKKRAEIMRYRDVKICRLLSLRQQLMLQSSYFSAREAVLTDLKIGLLVIYATRLLFRVTKNLMIFYKKEFQK